MPLTPIEIDALASTANGLGLTLQEATEALYDARPRKPPTPVRPLVLSDPDGPTILRFAAQRPDLVPAT